MAVRQPPPRNSGLSTAVTGQLTTYEMLVFLPNARSAQDQSTAVAASDPKQPDPQKKPN